MPIQKPARLTLGNLDTGDTLTVQYNPEGVKEALDVVYGRVAPQGMSHQLLQYGYTDNFKIDFTLKFDRVADSKYDLDNARRFLLSTAYSPRNSANGMLATGQPSDVAVIWPKVYTLSCKLISLAGDLETFFQDGSISRYAAHLRLEEIRDLRLWQDDVRRQGTIRGARGTGDPASRTANG